MIDLPN